MSLVLLFSSILTAKAMQNEQEFAENTVLSSLGAWQLIVSPTARPTWWTGITRASYTSLSTRYRWQPSLKKVIWSLITSRLSQWTSRFNIPSMLHFHKTERKSISCHVTVVSLSCSDAGVSVLAENGNFFEPFVDPIFAREDDIQEKAEFLVRSLWAQMIV